ncbi:hypothetical protein KUTeg_015634 [Tegillarca granosa]|uniref:Serine-threonine/tyrosine-protein kinase catalytic domain-containing protein n=1 Tax=Tegillarca granosa TaxID=220873 RepID=A0ABQ9EQV9_TEGGR|nr:hypothetical protein KUTeg_015634 [Tegillarca granosa]
MKLESDLHSLWWKIKWEDVVIGNRATSRSGSRFSNIQSSNELDSQKSKFDMQIFTTTGLYKGNVVAIKTLNLQQLYIDREILMQLKQLRDINSQNLTRFIGISFQEPSLRVMTEYCSRGSLEFQLLLFDFSDNIFFPNIDK